MGVTDTSQTFPELSYDVSYVNTLTAPAALEASNVPITSGSPASLNLKYYSPKQDWGWNGSNKSAATFDPLVKDFVSNNSKSQATIGDYFGGKGWPQYYNPNPADLVIPSGANIFDDSPLDTRSPPGIVHTSHYDSNQWLLSSSGGGAIAAYANGTAQSGSGTMRQIALSGFGSQDDRNTFVQSVDSMLASKQSISVTVSGNANYPGALGTFKSYDPSSSVVSYTVTKGGSGYSDQTQVEIVSSNGAGSGAKGQVNLGPNGTIASIGILPEFGGSGYTAPPIVKIIDPTGKGKGAEATAAITGGTVTVELAGGESLPSAGSSYVFQRIGTDYASTDITNLWYSWAQYYVNSYATKYPDFQPEMAQGSFVYDNIGLNGPYLTNQITFNSLPPILAVGMTVTASDLPEGATVLQIVGNTVYLSQIPTITGQTPNSVQYTFGLPTASALPTSPFTKPYTLSFDSKQLATNDPQVPDPTAFAGAVYEAMAVEATAPIALPPNNYLTNTMYVVDNVIKFNANIPTGNQNGWSVKVVAEVRDIVKSILRGVVSYVATPNQSLWYPDPAKKLAGSFIDVNGVANQAPFNVYNLDPYVWFVHKVEGLSGYGFSVDDDVANPIAPGPDDPTGNPTSDPNNLQVGFAGLEGTGATPLGNQQEWFPTTRWGKITTMATIGEETGNPTYNGVPIITLVPTKEVPNPLRTLNQIALPAPGGTGATITAPDDPGVFAKGTQLIFFPDGPDQLAKPNIQLSQKPLKIPSKPIEVVIDGAPSM